MSEPLSDSLKKIARGTGVALVGTFLALLLGFAIRLIIARYGSESDYGVYSLAIVIVVFATTLVSLGLPDGVTRFVAYFRGKGETEKARGVTSVSLQLTTIVSIAISLILFFGADFLANNVFHTAELAGALRIIAFGIPFYSLTNVLVSIFRGYDRMEPQAYFQYVLFNVLFLLLVGALAVLHLPFAYLFYTYTAAVILTFIGLLVYTFRKLPQPLKITGWQKDAEARKELLAFSLPLFATALLSTVVLWSDTLLLGYFKTSDVVGLYNAATPLARFVSDPLSLMILIYTPVVTGLYSRNLMAELNRSYVISTKWIVSLTLPFFLVLCLFPEAVVMLFFGPTYIAAAPALRILAIGFIIANFFGPNQSLILAIGDSRYIMWTALAGVVCSLGLNLLLIPRFGLLGAAITMAVSVILVKAIVAVKAYSACRAQPMSMNLFKPVLASVVLALLFKFVSGYFMNVTWWTLLLLFILYYVIYAVAVVFTRSFDREDIHLLLDIEKMTGINASPIKKILRRFV